MSDPDANDCPVFSVIIPLEFHRGQTERCLVAWTREQTFPKPAYELVIVAPDDFPATELETVRSFLRTQDRILTRHERHDIPLCAAGAEEARGKWLFFTESHVWPEADVLTKAEATFRQHPEWTGFSCRSVRITHNRLSVIEADLYEADIEEGMLRHPWRKILDQCFVVRREPYFETGGFDPTLGHFSEWLLAARFYRAGFALGYAPDIQLHHYYVGDISEWTEFTEDFVAGELRFLARRPRDPCTTLFQEIPEWSARESWRRSVARRMIKLIVADAFCRRETDAVSIARQLLRWVPIAMAGPRLAWAGTLLRTWGLRLQIAWAAHLGSQEQLRFAMTRYSEAVVRLQRLRGLCDYEEKRELEASAVSGEHPNSGEWNFAADGDFSLAGFHLAESWCGESFRWSEPAAMIELPLAAGVYTILIAYLPLRSPSQPAEPLFYFNEHPIGDELVQENEEDTCVSVRVRLPVGSGARLGWVCHPQNAPDDIRALGLPIRRITWQRVDEWGLGRGNMKEGSSSVNSERTH